MKTSLRARAVTASAVALAALLLGGAIGSAPVQDTPAAVVVRVEGTVDIHRGSDFRAAAVGDRLSDGDRIVPAAGSRAVIVSRAGASQVVTEATTLAPPPAGEDETMFSRTVRVLAQAATTDARSQPNRQGMIRPLPGQPALIAPKNRLSLMDERPTFTWFSVPEATAYRLQLRRDGAAPVRFDVGADTVWTLPADAAALLSGGLYRWTVAPVGSGRVAAEGTFSLLGEKARREVEESLDMLRELGLDPEGDGLFLAAVIYQDAGLVYDAAETFRRLERSGARLGSAGLLLRGEVLNALGDLDGAADSFNRADALAREGEAGTGAGREPSR